MHSDLRKAVLRGGAGGVPTPSAAATATVQGLGPLGTPADAAGLGSVPLFHRPSPSEASSWQAYWDTKEQLELSERGGRFNVYAAGPEDGPLVLCLHGGGYTGLTWSLLVPHLKHKYRVVAPDLRGHGETTTDNDLDFSKETMTEDILAICEHITARMTPPAAPQPSTPAQTASMTTISTPSSSSGPPSTSASSGTAAPPSGGSPPRRVPTVLVGHSMGGGLAVWAAASKRIAGLEGVVVIDVVEGTALAALPHMVGVVGARPASFRSLEEAMAWAARSGMARNKQAAAVSIPSQLRPAAQGQQQQQQDAAAAPSLQEEDPPSSSMRAPSSTAKGGWVWRTPLLASQPYWDGWYRGLSEAFLGVRGAKALLLAGTDRLDKPLTIGQMQGKFQLILMPTAGHAIHEDEADKTADHLLQFLKRFRIGEPPLQFPKAPLGVRPVLPVVAGVVHPGAALKQDAGAGAGAGAQH